jgi:hypothetical protein
MFHLVKCAIDVARLKFNPAAAVDDEVRFESKLARVERAVLHAVIQSEPHQINVFDAALFEVVGESGVAAMRDGSKIGASVENVFKQTIDSEVTLSTVLPA